MAECQCAACERLREIQAEQAQIDADARAGRTS